MKKRKTSLYLLFFILFAFILYTVVQESFFRSIEGDEFEHLYAAFQIAAGQIPYVDFFEHHHPLLWYLFAPLTRLSENSILIVYIGRALMLGLLFVNCVYLFKIGKLIQLKTSVALGGVLFYLLNQTLLDSVIEIRPDNPMNTLFIMGIYYLLSYDKTTHLKSLCLSLTCFTLSFLFLQKSLFFGPPIGLIILYWLWKKRLTFAALGKGMIPSVVLLTLSFLYLVLTKNIQNYFELNWLLNMDVKSARCNLFLSPNTFILLILGFSFSLLPFIQKSTNTPLKLFSFISLFLGIWFYLTPTPWPQYWSTYFALISVLMAYWFNKNALTKALITVLYFINIIMIVFFLCDKDNFKLKKQSGPIHFILREIPKTEYVVDNIGFNLHYKNAFGYYWFSRNEMALLYTRKFNHAPKIPNVNQIIRDKKPAIVLNQNLTDCTKPEFRPPNCPVYQWLDIKLLRENYIQVDPSAWLRKDILLDIKKRLSSE